MNKVTPIFLISLPRAGSTLLQQLLVGHNKIASSPEPWILLPPLYHRKAFGSISEYGHHTASEAINEIIEHLPEKENDYYKAVRSFASTIYQGLCRNDEPYFLDKTPRYYLIIDEIVKVFPDAKFIFLFRNPLSFFASQIGFTSNNRDKLTYLSLADVDFIKGVPSISRAAQNMGDNAIAIRYEDMVSDVEVHIEIILDYLGLDFEPNLVEGYQQRHFDSKRGDPYGVKQYKEVSKTSLDKWRTTLNSKFRIKLARRYIMGLDSNDIVIQGYEKDAILKSLQEVKPIKAGLVDAVQYRIGCLFTKFQMNLHFHLFSFQQHYSKIYFH